MNNFEWNDSTSLCCCEYYNTEDERSHILGCCCNCQDLDESFDNLIRGQRIPQQRKTALMTTIQDRIRIPWRGGAKQMSADSIAPVILVPLAILLSAFDLILTIIILVLVPLFLYHTFIWFRANHPKTKFFVVWGIVSFVVVAVIFETKVIALLEILPEENIALGILTALFVFCAYRVRITARRWHHLSFNDEENSPQKSHDDFCTICRRKIDERMFHCLVCQVCVAERDFHFVWFDCCIGSTNNGMFLLTLILGIATLLYSSNLTLTTVCHPFTVFEIIMLPDDCSEVYEQYDMALCFTSAVYSILMALYLTWIFFQQLLTISLGITGQEWRQLPTCSRLCCALKVSRPYNQGFIRNWLRIFSTNSRNKSFIHVEN